MDKLSIRDETQEFHGLWQQQHRGRCKQYRIRQGDNGADRAGVAWLLIRVLIGGRLPLGGFGRGIRRETTARVVKECLCRPDLTRRRSLRGSGVEMTERKRELHGERKQREPRAMFDVRPEPLHADKRLSPEGQDIPVAPTLQYNIAMFAGLCQP